MQCGKSRIRIWKMVQNPGADDEIELATKFMDTFEPDLLDLKIIELVFALQRKRTFYAVCTDIYAHHIGIRPANSIPGSLRRTTSGDKNTSILAKRLIRPEQV